MLTPAIGARTILVGTSTPPIAHGCWRFTGIGRWYRRTVDGGWSRGYHPPPPTAGTPPAVSCSGLQEGCGEGSHPHTGGLQEAPAGDRGAVDRAPARGRGTHPHRARVRRHHGERGVRLGEERPGPSRGAHRDARGAAGE